VKGEYLLPQTMQIYKDSEQPLKRRKTSFPQDLQRANAFGEIDFSVDGASQVQLIIS
jgi:hypothetical protein